VSHNPNAVTDPGRRVTLADRDAVFRTLRAGEVPTRSLDLIQVGRAQEVGAIVDDLRTVVSGGATLKVLVGEFGSGKSFTLAVTRGAALATGLVVARVDLSPSRRLHGTEGQARATYATLTASLATASKPDGGSLPAILERLAGMALSEAALGGPGPEPAVRERLAPLTELPGGYDFTRVVECYIVGHDSGEDGLKDSAVRWLRGEVTSKADARAALGVRTVPDDANWLDMVKLLAGLVRLAGYRGLVVLVDELAVLQRIQSPRARQSNYEQILRMWIESYQGRASGLGFVLATTPEALLHPRTGIYSYEALRSRLAENSFAVDGLRDHSGPVLRLAPLGREELFLLAHKLRRVFALGGSGEDLLPDEGITEFMRRSERRWGEAAFRSPRDTVKAFCDLLAALDQNPGTHWSDVLAAGSNTPDTPDGSGDELASFTI